MGHTSKTLLTSLIISLFSLSAIQGIKFFYQRSPQVLGETTIATSGIPCAVINNWQQKYCSSVVPSTYPTYIPTPMPPTPTTCKTGVNSFGVGPVCKTDPSRYNFARYTCYDNTTGLVGDSYGVNCYTASVLQQMAFQACVGKTSCTTAPTPTKIMYPTSTPISCVGEGGIYYSGGPNCCAALIKTQCTGIGNDISCRCTRPITTNPTPTTMYGPTDTPAPPPL